MPFKTINELKLIFHSWNTIVPNAFNYLNRPRKKFVRLIWKKNHVFSTTRWHTVHRIPFYLSAYTYIQFTVGKLEKIAFQLSITVWNTIFFSVLSMQPYKWDFVYENSFSITILRHAKFLSDIYYSRTVFFSLNSQWLYLECQFFTTFFFALSFDLLCNSVGLFLDRSDSRATFVWSFVQSMFVLVALCCATANFFFSFACMVIFINLFPIHLFETALFFAFICFLNDSDSFFPPILIFTLSLSSIYYTKEKAPNSCCFYYNFETFAYTRP